MSELYTVYLKSIMENEDSFEKLSTALSTYPLYEQANKSIPIIIPERSELNRRLLNAYKYRQIGFETVGRFLDELEIVMCEIMPYYNELYKTVEIMAELENPFDNVDFTEQYKETRSGTATNEAKTSTSDEGTSRASNESHNQTTSSDSSSTNATVQNSSKNVHSETPQSVIGITANNIDSVPYADDVTWNKSNNNDSASTSGQSSGSSDSDSTQETKTTSKATADTSGTQSSKDVIEHTFTKKGNQGVNTYAHDMIEFRQSIIDVTNRIINDERISELFMRVF